MIFIFFHISFYSLSKNCVYYFAWEKISQLSTSFMYILFTVLLLSPFNFLLWDILLDVIYAKSDTSSLFSSSTKILLIFTKKRVLLKTFAFQRLVFKKKINHISLKMHHNWHEFLYDNFNNKIYQNFSGYHMITKF